MHYSNNMNPDILIFTKDMIEKGMSSRGGFNKKQLATIGVEWPPQKGWKHHLIGKTITKDQYEKFLYLSNNI